MRVEKAPDTDTPEASIAIPCYNGQGPLLRQAVQSALDQESAEEASIAPCWLEADADKKRA